MEIINVGNNFKFAILAAKRAKQILRTGKKKVDMIASNPLTIALEEIRLGLTTNLTFKEDEQNIMVNANETGKLQIEAVTDKNNKEETKLKEKELIDIENVTNEDILRKNLSAE